MGNYFDSNSTDIYDNTTVVIKGNDDVYTAGVTIEERLKVDSKINTISIPPNAFESQYLRYEDMNVSTGGVARDTVLPSTFTTIYSYSGSGLFHGFQANYDEDNNCWTRMIVDGYYVLFGTDGVKSFDLKDNGVYDVRDIGDYTTIVGISMHDKSIRFVPPSPLTFNSSVIIQARTDSNKKFKAGFAVISKYT